MGYRVRQFWLALTASPALDELQEVQQFLSPPLMQLFLRMQPSEQAHSLNVYCQLIGQGEQDRDLLAAALLHDVGKTCCPLRVWERMLIVIGKTLAPSQAKSWGQGPARGWRRAFVVAKMHPAWGAEMAAKAGASPLTAALVHRHQDPPNQRVPESRQDILLQRLQHFDNES